MGIKRNGGLPMCHSESALVYASASTSLWLKPYSDWPQCYAGSASRQLPLFLPRSTRGSLFGQEKVSNSVCNIGTFECSRSRFRRLECYDKSEQVAYSMRRLLPNKSTDFHSYVFRDIRASTRFMLPPSRSQIAPTNRQRQSRHTGHRTWFFR